jgi:N-acetylmuramic acid 6-phosphate etherase
MVALGRTYSNLMVEMNAANGKLRGRVLTILTEASGEPEEECARALAEAGGDVKTAIVALIAGVDTDKARAALAVGEGRVRAALQTLGKAATDRR